MQARTITGGVYRIYQPDRSGKHFPTLARIDVIHRWSAAVSQLSQSVSF